MTPTAAVEDLLGLTPLHVTITAGVQMGTYRLKCTQQWRPKSNNFSHTTKISAYGAQNNPIDGVC